MLTGESCDSQSISVYMTHLLNAGNDFNGAIMAPPCNPVNSGAILAPELIAVILLPFSFDKTPYFCRRCVCFPLVFACIHLAAAANWAGLEGCCSIRSEERLN